MLQRLGKLLGIVSKITGEPEFSLQYTVADPEAAKNELLAKVVEDSKAKAYVLTKAAGVELGDILTIDYSWGEVDFITRDEIRSRGCIIVSADEIKSAEATYNSYGDRKEPIVNIQFNDAGTKLFAEATQRAYANNCESIGIYYDGDFISVPRVQAAITDGKAVISGMEDYSEAAELANKLNGR